jgi:hypothetical protein
MSTWIPVAIVIVAVLAAGFVKEHLRVAGVERWARAKGFKRVDPFTPGASASVVALASSLHQRGARLWGLGLEGMVGASPCTIAEYSAAKPGTRTGEEWFTLVSWSSTRRSDGEASPRPRPAEWPHEGILVRAGHLSGLRLPGMLTAATLDQAITLTPEARQRSA